MRFLSILLGLVGLVLITVPRGLLAATAWCFLTADDNMAWAEEQVARLMRWLSGDPEPEADLPDGDASELFDVPDEAYCSCITCQRAREEITRSMKAKE